jgi:predicted alpha/beta-hydrolase family hydrolase
MKRSLRELAASLRSRARRVIRGRRQPDDAGADQRDDVRHEVAQLRSRVAQLEREIVETQRLGGRVAELIDLVQELLLPAADRDDVKLQELLARYDAGN